MATNTAIGAGAGLVLKALIHIPGALKALNRLRREVDIKTGREGAEAFARNEVTRVNAGIVGCGGISCFVAGTPVLTAEGMKPIEQIQVGELVSARNELTGETRWQRVEQVIVTHDREVWDYVFVDALGVEESLGATPIHPFHTPSGAWVEVGKLELGADASSFDGRALILKSKSLRSAGETTYNFEIAEDHTYFVGRSGFWVHNGAGSCAVCPPDFIVTPSGTVMPTNTDFNLVSVKTQNGEWLQIHNTHTDFKGGDGSHTHFPVRHNQSTTREIKPTEAADRYRQCR